MVITQALADALEADYDEPMPPTMIAPNGVDLSRYQDLPSPAEARRQLGLPDLPTTACTGHLYEGRGVELFLALADRMPEVQFLWVGGRPKDVQHWQARAAEAGLANVSFPGFVPNADLPLYQAAADILLMPYQQQVGGSSGEAPVKFFSSMKMYEYMAANRPIISSDLPVIHEVLDADRRSTARRPMLKAGSRLSNACSPILAKRPVWQPKPASRSHLSHGWCAPKKRWMGSRNETPESRHLQISLAGSRPGSDRRGLVCRHRPGGSPAI